jgi:hypothetical protein
LKVRATQRGFLHWIRQVGEEFDVKEHLFSPEWMQIVDSPKAADPPPADNAHVAPGCEQFAGPQATAEPDEVAASDPLALTPTNKVPPT